MLVHQNITCCNCNGDWYYRKRSFFFRQETCQPVSAEKCGELQFSTPTASQRHCANMVVLRHHSIYLFDVSGLIVSLFRQILFFAEEADIA